VYVTRSVRVVDNLKTILVPTLCVPHTAQRLHEYLGYEGQPFDRLRTGSSAHVRYASFGSLRTGSADLGEE
jgi:hypothetical protein